MAKYKVVDADQLDINMKSIADAIRAKTGTTDSLNFPDDYISAVEGINDGSELPVLINPGTASDLLKDRELIDQSGSVVTGIIPTNTASNITVSGADITVPAGFYPERVSKSVTTTEQATPEITVSSDGLITASSEQNAGYVSAGTRNVTKQLTTKAAETFTPGTKNQTITSGKYLIGTQTIQGDSNLVAENIADGVTIFGVEGTHTSGFVPSGEINISANGTYDVTEYESAKVAIPSVTQATPSISVSSSGLITASATQSAGFVSAGTKSAKKQLTTQGAKTITPSASNQTAVEKGVYTTGEITVNAVPSTTLATPSIVVNSNGLITASITQQEGFISADTKSATKQLATNPGGIAAPSTKNITISSGVYLTGDIIIAGSPDLIPSNIRSGVNIFGVIGTYTGG